MKRTSERARCNLQTERKDADVRLAKIKTILPLRRYVAVSLSYFRWRVAAVRASTFVAEPGSTSLRAPPAGRNRTIQLSDVCISVDGRKDDYKYPEQPRTSGHP